MTTTFTSDGQDINQLALDGPSKAALVWDAIGFSFDKKWSITDASLGIDIPMVDMGFTLNTSATAKFVVEMGYDAGAVDFSYSLGDPTFVGNAASVAIDGVVLPYFRHVDSVFDTGTIGFASGTITPIPGDLAANYLRFGIETGLHISAEDIHLSASPPWPLPDIDFDFGDITFVDKPTTTNWFFDSSTIVGDGNSPLIEADPDAIITGELYLPALVGQRGEGGWGAPQVEPGGQLPTLSVEGDAVAPGTYGNFFNLELDIDRAISKALGIPNLNDTISIADGLSISYNLIDADFTVGLKTSQKLAYVVDGVSVSVDAWLQPYVGTTLETVTPYGGRILLDHVEGMLGDRFVFDTPPGQGVVEYETTYHMYGHFISEAGIRISGAFDLSALAFSLHNTIGPDFDVGFGPLIDTTIPDPPFTSGRLDLYEESLPVELSAATQTYRVFVSEPVVEGTDGNDFLPLNFDQDDPSQPPFGPVAVHGWAGDDTILGSDFRNILYGDAGGDQIDGNGGDDTIWAGSGADVVDAGAGADLVYGGTGDDDIFGGIGEDELLGLGGDDTVRGGSGADRISSGMGSDQLFGGEGEDTVFLDNLDGNDIADGGYGIDRIVVDARTTFTGENLFGWLRFSISGGVVETTLGANHTLSDGTSLSDFEEVTWLGGFGNDTLYGADGNDRLSGFGGNDTIWWSEGNDELYGGTGEDTIVYRLGTGPDIIDGGGGRDLLVLEASGAADLDLDLALIGDGHSIDLSDGTTIGGFERIDFDGSVYGGVTGRVSIKGGVWDDVMVGGSGDDRLEGRGGHNQLYGSIGDDTLVSTSAGDLLSGGVGDDLAVVDRTGTGVAVTIDLDVAPGVTLDRTLIDRTRLIGIERIEFYGGEKTDIVTGGSGFDVLVGNGGADVLSGAGGADWVFAGAGDDRVEVEYGRGGDFIDGGDDFDTLIADYRAGTANVWVDLAGGGGGGMLPDGTVFQNFERLEIRTGSGDDHVFGSDEDPGPRITVIRGPGGPLDVRIFTFDQTGDHIATGAGDDVVDGGRGSDRIDTGIGDDTVYLSHGLDVINAGDEKTDLGRRTDRDTLVVQMDRFQLPEQLALAHFTLPTAVDGVPAPVDGTDVVPASAYFTTLATGAKVVGFERLDFEGSRLDEVVQGGNYADRLAGNDGADVLTGLGGADWISDGLGDDHVDAGTGDDTILLGTGSDTIDAGDGDDVILSPGGGTDVIPTFPGGEVAPTDGGGRVGGGPESDTILAGGGDDTVHWTQRGAVDGGEGYDTLVVSRLFGAGFTGDFRGASWLMGDGSVITGFERIEFQGSWADDSVSVGYGAHLLDGGSSFFSPDDDHATIDLTGVVGPVSAHWVVDWPGAEARLVFADGLTVEHFERIEVISGAGGFEVLNGTPDGSPRAALVFTAAAGMVRIDGTDDGEILRGASRGLTAEEIHGHGGNDRIYANAGADLLFGGDGDDHLDGGLGADVMHGGAGADTYVVDDPGDVVDESFDQARGDDGAIDTVRSSIRWAMGAAIENLVLTGTGSVDGLGNALDNRITGNVGDNDLFGDAGDDVIRGEGGTDFLDGGLGDDFLDGGEGGDTMIGGAGDDFYIVDRETDVVDETDGAGGDAGGRDMVRSSASHTLSDFVETLALTGTDAVDGTGNRIANTITGNDAANRIDGAGGNDRLRGGGGDDELIGGSGDDSLDGSLGDDTMRGGSGDDTYTVDAIGDVVDETGGGGNDLVIATADHHLTAFVEKLTLAGLGAIDGWGNDLANLIRGNIAHNEIHGAGGDDTLEGGAGADLLDGGSGNDRLDGGTAADRMTGGAGDDAYLVDDLGDLVDETDGSGHDTGGNDRVSSSVSFILSDFVEALTLTGVGDFDGVGNGVANVLRGNLGDNALDGRGGDDQLFGELGSDILVGGTGNDRLNGGGGGDEMRGGSGDDVYTVDDLGDSIDESDGLGGDAGGNDLVASSITFTLGARVEMLTLTGSADLDGTGNGLGNRILGNDGRNTLSGQGGNDILSGGNGDDVLIGGMGNDVLTGGADADHFVFDFGAVLGGRDTVKDFTVGIDVLDLDDAYMAITADPTGHLSASEFVVGAAATTAFHRIVYDQTTGALSYDADGVGGAAPTQFATLAKFLALGHEDILVV